MTPMPHQIEGALFLAGTPRGYLADEPRVGKTGAAIMAADHAMCENVLVITTSSGRPVWRRAFADWSSWKRTAEIAQTGISKATNAAIVSWGNVTQPAMIAAMRARKWDAVIIDEAHFAKNFTAKRTQALFGVPLDGGRSIDNMTAIVGDQPYIWPLSGTPMPNSPHDLYAPLRALAPWRLEARDGMPDVTREHDFMHRYCVVKMKKLNAWKRIPVVIGGKNEAELRARLEGFFLRRTQKDVGIGEPLYDVLPLTISERMRRDFDADPHVKMILDAAESGDTRTLEMHLGPMRRITGAAKALSIVEAVKDEFECGLDKIVIAYWHTEVGAILKGGLEPYGVVGIDGATSASIRERAVERFRSDPGTRVFLGQIQAAGEAIDLSASAELLFAETSFIPKDMKQMSLRITNHTQTRQTRVRVAALAGSIDEALQQILMRKWTAIREVLPT